MIEAAMVFDKAGQVFHFHLPPGRSGGSIPDSRDLWEVLWENRHNLGGVAHTHPWKGSPWPSQTDVTTFRAVEKGLGVLLVWPVVTFSEVGFWAWDGKEYVRQSEPSVRLRHDDIERLRELSR